MTMNEALREKMASCTILNGYEGLDELEQLAIESPVETASIAWDVLLLRGDPGKDDYALCSQLFKILGVAVGKTAVADQVLHCWQGIDDDRRLNLLAAIESKILETDRVRELFYATASSTRLRHRIAAALASCRFAEAKETIRKMVMDIGRYDSPEKQEILDGFRETVLNTD
jgi:hypothetical protein